MEFIPTGRDVATCCLFEKALTLDPNNENAKEMLKKLKEEVKKE